LNNNVIKSALCERKIESRVFNLGSNFVECVSTQSALQKPAQAFVCAVKWANVSQIRARADVALSEEDPTRTIED